MTVRIKEGDQARLLSYEETWGAGKAIGDALEHESKAGQYCRQYR
jgi:hypothetical protein